MLENDTSKSLYLLFIFNLVTITTSCGSSTDKQATTELASADSLDYARLSDPYESSALSGSTPSEAAALDRLNAYRQAAGIQSTKTLAKLTVAAQAHANYISANPEETANDSHNENSASPGFTGETVGQRIDAQGFDRNGFWVAETVSRVDDSVLAIERFIGSVYHRSPFLSPGSRYLGYGKGTPEQPADVFNLMIFGDVTGLEPTVFPGADMTDIPVKFLNSQERPNPFPNVEEVGFPISVHFPRYIDTNINDEPELRVTMFKLTEGDVRGPVIPTLQLTHKNDSLLAHADAFICAATPLKPGTRYTVQVQATYGGFSIAKTWSFTTSSDPESRFIGD